jgi:hypothetical protein
MRIHDIHSLKHSVNKWLFAVVLLASVFAFSGVSLSPRAGHSPVRSTWIIRGSKSTVNSVLFSTSRPNLSKQVSGDFAGYSIVDLCLLHNKACAIKLKQCRRFNLISSYKILPVHKTIPQNGKADPSPVLA